MTDTVHKPHLITTGHGWFCECDCPDCLLPDGSGRCVCPHGCQCGQHDREENADA